MIRAMEPPRDLGRHIPRVISHFNVLLHVAAPRTAEDLIGAR
jgi:hypothetical protein